MRGTSGLVELTLTVRDEAAAPLRCTLSLAHWYTLDVGEVAPGAELAIPLWRDPRDGTVYALNAEAVRMPVEALRCGVANIELPRERGTLPARTSRVCTSRACR